MIGIQLGSTVSAAIAVPVAGVLGGWRAALIALSVVSCLIAGAWAVLERGSEPTSGRRRSCRGCP